MTIQFSTLFFSLEKYLKAYSADRFELIIGTAISVNEEEQSVEIKRNDGSTSAVPYCATGSRSTSPLWTLHDDPQQSINEFKMVHERLPKSKKKKKILIAGGGPVGVEAAVVSDFASDLSNFVSLFSLHTGEVASACPDKKITLISGSTQLLTRLTGKSGSKVGKGAEKYLTNMGVTTLHNVLVKSTTQSGNQTAVEFDARSQDMTVDLYIDATGGVRNSEWLPPVWLTPTSQVSVDGFTLRHVTCLRHQ